MSATFNNWKIQSYTCVTWTIVFSINVIIPFIQQLTKSLGIKTNEIETMSFNDIVLIILCQQFPQLELSSALESMYRARFEMTSWCHLNSTTEKSSPIYFYQGEVK